MATDCGELKRILPSEIALRRIWGTRKRNKRLCSGSLSISLKLRIRAVVWKRGAHQPGGPPLRTTAAHHFRTSPPGMDAEAGCVGPCETLGPDHHVFPTVRRREAHRSRRIQYWLAEATGSPQYSNATKQHTNGPFCRKS